MKYFLGVQDLLHVVVQGRHLRGLGAVAPRKKKKKRRKKQKKNKKKKKEYKKKKKEKLVIGKNVAISRECQRQ